MSEARVVQGDVFTELPKLQPCSFQMVCTSPPFWGLRDYGTAKWEGGNDAECDHREAAIRVRRNPAKAANACDGGNRKAENRTNKGALGLPFREVCGKCGARRVDAQLGLERIHDCLGWATGNPCGSCYVCHLVAVFREVRRVLRPDGVVFLNLGDSYSGSGKGGNPEAGKQAANVGSQTIGALYGKTGETARQAAVTNVGRRMCAGLRIAPKQLCGIPWRVALALQADGWWLRSDIIWHKPNPMPESVTDRATRSHEYIFMLTKSARYYFDAEAVKEGVVEHKRTRWLREKAQGLTRPPLKPARDGQTGLADQSATGAVCNLDRVHELAEAGTRNLRSVWTIATKPFSGCHFATFPPDLPKKCIKAATSEKGECPKCGKQWVRVVETTPGWSKLCPKTVAAHQARGGTGIPVGHIGTAGSSRVDPVVRTTGWRPGCKCGLGGDILPGDFDIIETPTGERVGDDPSLETGRAGMNRPHGDNEGRRSMTRYQQRKYAEQLRACRHWAEMREEVGGRSTFDHYMRTDKPGARPIPPDVLDGWIKRGWLTRVDTPTAPDGLEPIPSQVLDPFGGAGTTAVVAIKLGRNATIIELNPAYCEIARKRIAAAQAQGRLAL